MSNLILFWKYQGLEIPERYNTNIYISKEKINEIIKTISVYEANLHYLIPI